MSEYVRKQALVEWLDESIQTLRGLAIGFRNQGNELAERGCHRDADGLYVIMKKIQSGAFDAEPDGEVQRLKVALAKAKGWIKYLVYIGQNIEPEMKKKAFDEIDEILSGAREKEEPNHDT